MATDLEVAPVLADCLLADPDLEKWWKFWSDWRTKNRPLATTFTANPPSGSPDARDEPELHLIARDCFGFRDAGRAFEPGNPDNQLESHLHLTRKPGATGLDFEGDDPGIVTVTALGWASAPAMRALRLVHVYATREPDEAHHKLAERVIAECEPKALGDVSEVERRALARAICEKARELSKRLSWDANGLIKLPWWDMDLVAEALGFTYANPGDSHEALVVRWQHGRRVSVTTLDLPGSLDRAATFLEGIGENGQKVAAKFKGATDSRLWVRPEGPDICPVGPTRSPVMWSLAVAVWFDQVQPDLGKVATAKPFRHPTWHGDGGYVLAPKVISPIGWALGGHGVRVEVDGDEYMPAPGLTRYGPRLAALPSGQSAAQQYLPLDADDGITDGVPMEIRVAADAGMVLSESAGKLSVLLMATASPERLQRITVGELTKLLNPPRGDKPKRYQGRDYALTIVALNKLRSLALVPPRYSPINLFDLTCPALGESDPALTVWWGFSKALDAVLTSGGAELPGFNGQRSWFGSFLLNLTKAMQIPTKNALELRLYVYGAAKFNEVRRRGFDKMPWFTAESWAVIGNTVSREALDYARERDGGASQKVRLSEARKRATDALDYLHDERLVIVEANEAKGARRAYRLKPTEAFEAAYREILRGKGDS
jgi:hypothetical protein